MYWNCATIYYLSNFFATCEVSYFLQRYGNPYRFSQKGWENVIGQCKKVFHHNTQKDGGIGVSSNIVIGYKMALDMRQGRAYRVRSLSAVAATMLRCE